MLRAVVNDPLEEQYRLTYRTRPITRGQVREWLREGIISEERARYFLALYGLPDETINYEVEGTWTIPTLASLQEAVGTRIISEDYFLQTLTLYRYHPAWHYLG